MSDIPLHSLVSNRNSRAGYASVSNTEAHETPDTRQDSIMPVGLKVAASVSARKNGRLGRRRDGYNGEPEEEATLLGEDAEDGYSQEDEGDRRDGVLSDSASQVRRLCLESAPIPHRL